MPLPASDCQRCATPITWRVVEGIPAPFEADGELHRPRCPVVIPWGKARSVEAPQLVTASLTGYIIGIDLETTGIPGRIEDPEIVELAAALMRLEDGAVLHTFTQLVRPRGPLLAVEVHQITEAMLDGAPHIEEAIRRFNQWRRLMQDTFQDTPIPLVSHNAAFELSFLDPCDIEGPWICTLVMSQQQVRGRQPRGFHSLGQIVERRGLTYQGEAHRALPDAIICAEVYWMMTAEARQWHRMVVQLCARLADTRSALFETAPITAGMLLHIELALARRLRLFQDRPRNLGRAPEMPESWQFPWQPPEIQSPWPYRFHDPVVFKPIPQLLRTVRLVYRAERLGVTLTQLAQLRDKPEFEADTADRPRYEPPSIDDIERRAPHQPVFDVPGAAATFGRSASPPPQAAPSRPSPHQPVFGQPYSGAPAASAPEVSASRASPHQPTFGPLRSSSPPARAPVASDARPPSISDAGVQRRVSPIKPTFGKGR